MNLHEITALLKNVKKSGGGGYTAQCPCPAHGDKRNSLSVNQEGDKILLKCHALCTTSAVCEALGVALSDLFISRKKNVKPQITDVYIYRDESGEMLFESVRFDNKSFSQRHTQADGKTVWKLNGARRVPYKLPELLASDPKRAVFIVEGEKDVENLFKAGLIATTNPLGAGKWLQNYSDFLKNRVCYILPDNDDAGTEHAAQVASSLFGIAREIKIVNLPDLPEKGDVSDFLKNHSVADLKKIVKAAPVFDGKPITPAPPVPTEDVDREPRKNALRPLNARRLSDVEALPVNWLWKPFLAIGTYNLFEGEEQLGKTFAVCSLATAIASGRGLPHTPDEEHIEPSNVLLISAEDSLPHVLKPRLESMNAPCEKIIASDEPFTLDADGIFRLSMTIAEHSPKLVVIDPLFSYTGKVNLDRDSDIRSVTDALKRLAEKHECAILGIRHIGKSKGLGDPRAAGLNGIGWRSAARSVLLAGKNPENPKQKAIVQTKSNLAALFEKSIGFEIKDGKFSWTVGSDLTASVMLSAMHNETSEEKAEKQDAKFFLREVLKGGEKLATEIITEARKVGLSERTLNRAKSALKINSRKEDSRDGKWFWGLPEDCQKEIEDCQKDTEGCHTLESGNVRLNSATKPSYTNNLTEGCQPLMYGNLQTENGSLQSGNGNLQSGDFCGSCKAMVATPHAKCPTCGELPYGF